MTRQAIGYQPTSVTDSEIATINDEDGSVKRFPLELEDDCFSDEENEDEADGEGSKGTRGDSFSSHIRFPVESIILTSLALSLSLNQSPTRPSAALAATRSQSTPWLDQESSNSPSHTSRLVSFPQQ
jgi:hypothetical protein